jgi:hypothetical protein
MLKRGQIMKLGKEVFLTVLFAMLFMPLVAGASYPVHQYPNITPIEKMQPNGKYIVYVEKEGIWQEVGSISFDMYFRERQINLTDYISDNRNIKVRLVQQGGGAAHIDSVSLGDKSPIEVKAIENGLKKLSGTDFDVIEAFNKRIEMTFPVNRDNKILKLTARVESAVISKVPFQFPIANLYKEMSPASKFYTYEMGTQGTGAPLFKEYSLTGSGHPSGYTYGWVRHDKENIYVKIDFTPDNTMDGDKDYAAVYVKTEAGIKEFKVSMKEKIWGTPTFTYTDKVNYQHKVYDFVIPLREIGMMDAGKADEITLAFAAYGTASPFPGGAFNPSSNNYLVVYPRSGDIYGQLVDSDGNPVGAEITISTAANSQEYPSVAYNSSTNQYLVVWHDYRSGTTWDIYGQLVNANGSLSGGNFAISTATNNQMYPSVAYNSSTNQYLVVWHDYRSGTTLDIYGQLVDDNGSLLGVNFPISTAASHQSYPSVAYNSSTNQYLVVWQDGRSGAGAYDIYGQLVNANGSLSGGDFPISTAANSQYYPSVAYNSSTNQYLVVWMDLRSGTTWDIYGQLVNANGSLSGGDFPISTAADNQYYPSVAYNSSTNQYLVVWMDYRSGTTWDIYGQYLTGTGALTAGNFVIVDNPTSLESPHAVGNTIIGNYLVAYYDSSVPRDYAWVIVGQGQQVAIPTVSQWGMIIFILFAGFGAVYYLRKQRKANS